MRSPPSGTSLDVKRGPLIPVAEAFTGRGRVLLATVFLLSFSVYVATCARLITGEDAGELVAAAYTLGVAHPPGYPLWCLMAKASTWLPIGDVAFRVALLSALLGAITASLLAGLALVVSRSSLLAAGVALGFAFLRDQWFHSATVEVYTLNSAFLAACLLLLLWWSENLSWSRLSAFAFVFGLSLTNHHMMLGLAPVFLVFLLWHGFRKLSEWRPLVRAVGAFLLGLLPYAYLPLAAQAEPAINWGNPSSVQGFVDHVTRAQYRSADADRAAGERRASLSAQAGVFMDHALGQRAWPLLLAGLIGTFWLAATSSFGLLLLGCFAMSTVVAAWVIDFPTDFENSYASRIILLPAYLLMMPGAAYLVARLVPGEQVIPHLRQAVCCASALAFVAPPLCLNYSTCDYSRYTIAEDHGARLLTTLAPNAIIFPGSDHSTFPALYMHIVKKVRQDITFGDKYGYPDPPLAAKTPYGDYLEQHGRGSAVGRTHVEDWLVVHSARPVYFSKKRNIRSDPPWTMQAEGLWYRAYPLATPVAVVKSNARGAWDVLEETPIEDRVSRGEMDFSARAILADEHFFASVKHFADGSPDDAVGSAEQASLALPESKEMHNNLGSLLAENEQYEPAIRMLKKAVSIDGDYLVARRNLGVALRSAGRSSESREILADLIRAVPTDLVAARNLAEIHRDAKEWGSCVYYLELVGRLTGDWLALRDAGLIRLMELKDLAAAKRLLQESLNRNPDQDEIREVEGRIRPVGEQAREEAAKGSASQGERQGQSSTLGALDHRRGSRTGGAHLSEPMVGAPDPMSGLLPNLPEVVRPQGGAGSASHVKPTAIRGGPGAPSGPGLPPDLKGATPNQGRTPK